MRRLGLERQHASLAHNKFKSFEEEYTTLHKLQHRSCGCEAEGLMLAYGQAVHGTWTLPVAPPISWNHIHNPPLQETPRRGNPRSIEGFGGAQFTTGVFVWQIHRKMADGEAVSSGSGDW